jgi:hypothetical protein
MTAPIEVLDTAVKIGLGAAISGIATYLVTKLKSDRDLRNEMAKHKRELVERISLGVQQSASTISKVTALMHRTGVADEDRRNQIVSESYDLYLKVFEELNTAEALSAIIGMPQLSQELAVYADAALELFYLVRDKPFETTAKDEVIDRLNQSRAKISTAIHAAYEQTAS